MKVTIGIAFTSVEMNKNSSCSEGIQSNGEKDVWKSTSAI